MCRHPALLWPSAGCPGSLWTKTLVAHAVIAIHVQNEFAFAIPAELIFKCMDETHRIASLRLHCAYEVAEATQLPEKCFVASSSHVCSCGYTTPSWFEGDDLDRLYERCAPLYELLQQATPRNSTSWGNRSSKHLLVHVPTDMMSQFEGFQYWITMVVMDSSGVHSESD